MKKKIPQKVKNVLIFILGGIIIGGLGTAYAVSIASSSVSYDNTSSGATATDVKGAIDELYSLANNKECKTGYTKKNETTSGYECRLPGVASVLNLGDYISLTPDKSTYTISSSLTGYDSDQTITPNELTLWRVISKNDDDSVDVVSEYVSSTKVYFKGTTGYANFVGELQTIAEQYAKEGYTKSTRMMGYDGQTLTISNTSPFDGSKNTTPSTTPTPTPTTGTGQEYSGGVLGDTLYLKDYLLVKNVYGNVIAKKVGTTTAENYWLASRFFDYNSSAYFYFDGRCVNTVGGLDNRNFRYFNGSWHALKNVNAVRPILTLKSGVSIASGFGTSASPYVVSFS
ncbi:MAG: hypothetical protein IKE70_03770 [Bacilli bacterium]|nr:hypothetical protein [Bacilli bacterium]